MSTSTRGACLCGAVTFAIAPPYPWFAHCHCSLCRKQHGSLFGTGLGVPRDNLEWLTGTGDVVHYRCSTAFARPFCRHCGSAVPAMSHDERFWHVPAGLLTGDPGARPRSHIFVASQSPLHEIVDALPQHAAYPPGIELAAVERRVTPVTSGAIAGSCLCDGVAFSATSVPRRLVHCYCSLCRRRSGAAFSTTLLIARSDFSWLRGETRVRHYALSPTLGGSRRGATLGSPRRGTPRQFAAEFCAECGSPAPTVVAGAPTVMLPAGVIDTDLPLLPAVHLYVGSKVPWYSITDAGPQFSELPPPERFKDWFQ